MTSRKKWIGVALEGVLATFNGKRESHTSIGEPIEDMIQQIKKWMSEGYEVRIFAPHASIPIADPCWGEALMAIRLWCLRHLGTELVITNQIDFDMEKLIWNDHS